MAKRLAIVFFLVLATCIFIISGFFLVLLISPGMSAFGIKYIAPNTHQFSVSKSISDFEGIDNFNGSISIETYEMPIEVIFTGDQSTLSNFKIAVYDNFNGLTNSKFDDTSLSVTKNSNGSVSIKVNEFRSFIYETSSSSRYIKLYLPLAYIANTKVNLTLISTKGKIEIYKNTSAGDGKAQFANLSIKTNSSIDQRTAVSADVYELYTKNSIKIYNNEESNIFANSYNLTSLNGSIEVGRNVSGNISATTDSGNIKVLSCENLEVNTNYGNITCIDPDSDIQVKGTAHINSKAGNVEIGSILGSGESEIVTTSGNVTIKKSMLDGNISTSRGKVTIGSVRNAKISTNIGKVSVDAATESIDVSTKRGDIRLGGNGLIIRNPKVFTRLGKIEVNSSEGVADIQSLSNRIYFKNTNCSEITINSGDKLVAENLSGKVTINAYSDVQLSFLRISAQTEIYLNDEVQNAKIYAPNNSADTASTKYYLEGKSVTVYERNSSNEFNKVDSGNTLGSTAGATLIVKGKNANIEVYFG